MFINPKFQEINIPGIRKLKGGEKIPANILKKLTDENKIDSLKEKKYIIDNLPVKKKEIEKPEITEKKDNKEIKEAVNKK